MLLPLFAFLEQHFHRGFAVFQYLTLRAILSAVTALLVALLVGPKLITILRKHQIGQVVRNDGPQSHLTKSGTPTMGGILILIALFSATLLWSNLGNHYLWIAIFTTAATGIIGFYDDYRKIKIHNTRGLAGRYKFLCQLGIATLALTWLISCHTQPLETSLVIPFLKHGIINLGWFYLLFGALVISGSSNAVNLTDGLDGLATLPVVLIAVALGIFAYVSSNFNFASYLLIPYLSDAGELVIFCSALIGAGLGFLWFNTYPAQIFMGDVGSLALGAALGVTAVLVKQELALAIMGGVFVVETLSVIIQVLSFRIRGKRFFKMAPIHHHFELSGWAEPKIIVRFWIITFILVLIGLTSLKIR